MTQAARPAATSDQKYGPAPGSEMTTFGLVHGAYHGSWCWERLALRLEARSHRVLTVDLPCEDPTAGADAYAAATLDAFAAAGDDLVLVGHSLAGLTIPIVATRRPVARLVFLCAMLPRPGRSQDDVLGDEPDTIGSPPIQGGASIGTDGATRWDPEVAASWFFSDCTAADARWAAGRLRGQQWTITSEISPLERWPDMPSTAVIGSHDLVIDPAWSRRVCPVVLGCTPIELDCGHSPFLSKPDDLADVLVRESAGS